MTLEVENEISFTDEDKVYLYKIIDELFDEYTETLDDKSVESWVTTDAGAWSNASSSFLEWLHDKLKDILESQQDEYNR